MQPPPSQTVVIRIEIVTPELIRTGTGRNYLDSATRVCNAQGMATLRLVQGEGSAVSETIADFVHQLSAENRSTDTRTRYKAFLTKLAKDLGWQTPADARREDIARWLAKAGKGKSYNNKLAAIRTFFDWCRPEDNPTQGIRRATERSAGGQRAFTVDEMRRIIAAAPPKRAPLYVLSAATGLRKQNLCLRPGAEAAALRWGWVDFAAGKLEFPASAMKNNRALALPLSAEALEVLREIRPADAQPAAPVFPFFVDNRRLFEDMQKAKVPRVDARGKKVSWHSWRKGFLTALADAGVHPRVAQELAGHSSIQLTMRHYTGVNEASTRSAVQTIAGLRGVGTMVPTPAQDQSMAPIEPNPGFSRPSPLAGAHSGQGDSAGLAGPRAVGMFPASDEAGVKVRLRGVEPPRGINPRGSGSLPNADVYSASERADGRVSPTSPEGNRDWSSPIPEDWDGLRNGRPNGDSVTPPDAARSGAGAVCGVEQSVARGSHNPEVTGSIPVSAIPPVPGRHGAQGDPATASSKAHETPAAYLSPWDRAAAASVYVNGSEQDRAILRRLLLAVVLSAAAAGLAVASASVPVYIEATSGPALGQ